MTNYNKIRQDNIDYVDSKIKEFIEEMQLQDEVKYLIYPDTNQVKILTHKIIKDDYYCEYFEMNYRRSFYIPFDNECVCVEVLNDIYKLFLDIENLGVANIF